MASYSYGSLGTKSIYISRRVSAKEEKATEELQHYDDGGGPGRPDLSTELVLLLLGGIAVAAGLGWAWSQTPPQVQPPDDDSEEAITRADSGNRQNFIL